ncbi:thioredoxin [Mucilaginibacter oryzae]|uniref:Thioredoxin n=1 Tax=Mucilaginibacter oryzae TaxID=468058 RepID=A0A316HII0_9SPHI|nr:thioredoxin family protein [Mucilaginibacter oryzae]PWK79820.1 thioredoxin [Mucilaginibacter oryzae]
MKKLIKSLLFVIAVFYCQALAAQGVNFETLTLRDAMSKANDPANPKLILIDCYTSWCMPCLEMAQQEFPKKVAGDYINPKFVSIKFDMEKGEGKEIGKKYGVTAYPTFLILNAHGQEINRVVGKSTADEFIEKVKTALDPKNSLAGIKKAYEENKSMATGMPYALALYKNAKDPSPVLEEIFDKAMDFERFSNDYLELALGTVKFGSPFFRKMMMYKAEMDQAMGTEVINRIIFDKIRKDMYQIAAGTAARYNIVYTPQQVEDIAYTVGLMKLPSDRPETHMCKIALYAINKDLDGMIDYYKRYIAYFRQTDVFKGILDGILRAQVSKASEAQKAAIKAYFENNAKSLNKEAQQSQFQAESIK